MANLDLATLQQSAQYAAMQADKALKAATGMAQEHQLVRRELAANSAQLAAIAQRLEIQKMGGDPAIQRIENIPGRRIPMDFLVDIPVPANSTAVVQGSIQVPQDGPFVAVARMMIAVSAFQFQYTVPATGAVTSFQGRSYGRYRPIHSAWDLNDGRPWAAPIAPIAFPGTGAPFIASPANAASFRTMEGDFRVKFESAGSGFPRSNIEVPSAWWTKSINEPWELGCLDFFERAEVLTFKIGPMHPNNPAYGNISGFGANPLFPFIDSQWDAIEGINDQSQDLPADVDPIVRVPNLIITIGFHGFMIKQQPGVGGY